MLSHIVPGLDGNPAIKSVDPLNIDRRRSLRVTLPFPVIVRGVDIHGERFIIHTTIDNFSASSLSLRLDREIRSGAELFMVVRLSIGPPDGPALRVAVRGKVVRTDNHVEIAVIFRRHRLLYASAHHSLPPSQI